MKGLKFFASKKCGSVIEVLVDCENKFACCGEEMVELNANTTDAAGEKHVPVIEQDGNKVVVKVGSVLHPMEEKHHISFIVLHTDKGVKRVCPPVGGQPVAEFVIADDEKVIAAYEYCNLHGLWKVEA